MRRQIALAAFLGMCLHTGLAQSESLQIGASTLTSSVDPHFSPSFYNFQSNVHIYEPLVRINSDGDIKPHLATSWRLVDDQTWEFQLRRDVKWHDGSAFTAQDVAFSLDRAGGNLGGPNTYRTYLRPVAGVEVVDDHTLRIKTRGPAPTLLDNLAYVLIASKANGENKATEDFNSGSAAVGTGPFRLTDFTPNDRVALAANPDYWGGAPAWENVTFQVMPSTPARMAALASGSINIADGVPPQDLATLEKDERLSVWKRASDMVVFISVDAGQEALESGKLTGPNGEALTENPLGHPKVRQALKQGLDINAIVERVYRGNAVFEGQYMRAGRFGHSQAVKPWAADEAGARALLEEAGWAGKFKVVLSVSTGATFPLATQLAEIIAQSWTKIGIPTSVEVMPHPVFLQTISSRKSPLHVTGYNNIWGKPENFYATAIHSRTEDRSYGAINQAYYKNAEVDRLIEEGFATFDEARRREIFEEVSRLAVEDNQFMPLFHVVPAVATSATLDYTPRTDGLIDALNARKAQ